MALKVSKELKELRNAEVHYISLVDRSSSRMPFRIVKRQGDEEMALDLSALRTHKKDASVKTEQKQPITKAEIASVVVMAQKSDEEFQKIVAAVKAQGYNTDTIVKNADGATVSFMQPGNENTPVEDLTLIRLSDQMVISTKGFQPQHEGMADADFGSTASANSFYQGVDSSLDTLFSKICAVLTNAADEDDAGKQIGTLIDGFKKYVLGLVDQLPTAAFKADIAVRQLLQKDDSEGGDVSSPLMTTKLKNLLTNVPDGFTENDWTTMGTDDKLDWLMDSTNTRKTAEKEKDMADTKKGDIWTPAELAEKLQVKPAGFTATDGDWATMSTGDKLNWMAASYNEQTGDFSAAKDVRKGEENVQKVAAGADCPLCTATAGWNKMSKDDLQTLHSKHNGNAIKSEEEKEKEKTDKEKSDKLDLILVGLTSLKAEVQVIADAQKEDKKVLDGLTQKTETVEKTLKGTVVAASVPGDTPAGKGEVTTKADNDPRTGAFDTAFTRKRAVAATR